MTPGPLRAIAAQVRSRADAIRWACVLEATSPKAGNVHPSRSFTDLGYRDFIVAADCTAEALDQPLVSIAERMRSAVIESRAQTSTNVNLGIVLLLGPLVASDELMSNRSPGGTRHGEMLTLHDPSDWATALPRLLDAFTEDDGGVIYDAIRQARPGGLATTETRDVQTTIGPVDLLAAMRTAVERDRIAVQYASGFADLLHSVVPVVASAIQEVGDLLAGVAEAHLRLLSLQPDTLIARKCGSIVAEEVRRRAAATLAAGPESRDAFDAFLRQDGHPLNPGTTADLMAAALYVLLRSR